MNVYIIFFLKIYQIYINIRNYCLTIIYNFFNDYIKTHNKDYKLISIKFINQNNKVIKLPLNLELKTINYFIDISDRGYIKIKYYFNDNIYIQIVPWNQPINDQDIEIISKIKSSIELSQPIDIIYASNNNNDITEIINLYSGHLKNIYINSQFIDNYNKPIVGSTNLNIKYVKKYIEKIKNYECIEILTTNGLLIHI